MKTNKKTIIGLAAVLTLALTAFAYAHGGYGGGHMMGYGPGCGPYMAYDHHMRGDDNWHILSAENAAKLDEARDNFFDATRDLRRQIDERQYAIQAELRKDNPDTGKVIDLQKALSGLQAEFDQKALAYRMEVNKLLPQRARPGFYGEGYGDHCW